MHLYSNIEKYDSFTQRVASSSVAKLLRNSLIYGIRFAYIRAMKSAIAALLTLFVCQSSFGQKMYEYKHNSPYILLYQLNEAQADYAIRNAYHLDTAILYTNLVGKIHSDSFVPLTAIPKDYAYPIQPLSRKSPIAKGINNYYWNLTRNGYFLEVFVSGSQVQSKLIENPIFFSTVRRIGYETFVFVKDSSGRIVQNATVSLDTHQCRFDPSVGGYAIRRSNISGSLKITRGSDFAHYVVNGYNTSDNYGEVPRDDYSYNNTNVQGYLVTNLPVYKPGDTVFFKSYLVSKKAKPLKSEVIFRLSQNYTGHALELKVKPDPKGAYQGYFILDDSFALDQELYLYALDKNRQALLYKSLRYENYELKDIIFSLNPYVSEISRGEPIQFYINTLNKAGLPLLESSIKVEISLNRIDHAAADSLQLSFAKMRKYFVRQFQTDASGITLFEIPADSIPDIKGQWSVTFTLTTADNEIKVLDAGFHTNTNRDKTLASIVNDTLTVLQLHNMKLTRKKMRVQYHSAYDLIADSTILCPFKAYIAPNIQYVNLYFGDTFFQTLYRSVEVPKIEGKRSHDSIRIAFHSKHDIPVYYRIYRNNEIVSSGNDTVLNFQAKDASKNSYHLQYGILLGPDHRPQFYSQSFHLAEKQLQIEVIQPTVIYPGQEVAIEIRVKDAYGKPVRNVNLTAWAVNTQLDNVDKPTVPYLGKVKPQRGLPVIDFPVGNCLIQHYHMVKQWEISPFYLHERIFYRVLYPKQGFEVLRDTTPDHSTQAAFYNHKGDQSTPVNYVSLNDTLVYIYGVTPAPGVVRVKAGTYTLKVRVPGRLITFNNVRIEEGKKNFICLHTDSLQAMGLGDTMPLAQYTDEEFLYLKKHTLLFRYDYMVYDTLSIFENGQLRFATDPNQWNNLPKRYTAKAEYSKDGSVNQYKNMQEFYAFGPIQPNSRILMTWKNNYAHEFTFMPQMTVSMTKSDMIQREADAMLIGYKYFESYVYNSYNFNTFFWNPYFQPKASSIAYPAFDPQNYTRQTSLQEYQYKNYWPKSEKQSRLQLQLPQNHSVNRIWIFQQIDSSQSMLNNYTYGNYESESQTYIYYDLPIGTDKLKQAPLQLVLFENDSNWVVKNLEIDSQSLLVYRIQASDFRKLKRSEWIALDRMAKILGQEPFAPFEDTPTISKALNLIRMPSKTGILTLEGTVNGPELRFVVENAFVILEKNGYFVKGATTNRDGRFRMDSLEAGEYMLKIKGGNYHYWMAYNVKLDKGKLHIIQVSLRPHSNMYYISTEDVYAAEPEYDYDGVSDHYSYSASSIGQASYIDGVEVMSFKKTKRLAGIMGNESKDQKRKSEAEIVYKNNGRYDMENESAYMWNFGDAPSTADDGMLQRLASDPNAQRIRNNFRNYAYWIPNLNTNAKGYATFAIRFPDNITSWQTWVPAMDGKRHSGLGDLLVKSYKPVSSALALPAYVTEEDRLYLFGRIFNYTGTEVKGQYTFFIDSQGITKDVTINASYNDSLVFQAGAAGKTVSIENGFGMSNGYRDIQRRTLMIRSARVTTGMSSTLLLNRDTNIVFTGDASITRNTITLYGNPLSMVHGLIQQRLNSLYPDNLSMADELYILLTEKSLSESTGLRFEKDDNIKYLVKKIRNSQQNSGLFSAFGGENSSAMLSSYVAEVMYKADLMGYNNNAWLNVARHFEKQLPYLYGEDALEALLLLKRLNRPINHEEFLPRIEMSKLSLTGKLKYGILMGLLLRPIEPVAVLTQLKPSPMGNISIGSENPILYRYNPYFDNAATTYLAWEWLRLNNAAPELRKLMAQWMANEAGGSTRNIARASNMLLTELQLQHNGNVRANITINGKAIEVEKEAVEIAVPIGDTLNLTHTGAQIYVLQRKEWKTYTPISDTANFGIRTSFNDNLRMEEGKNTTIKATVFAKRSMGNVVVEIPIPAGTVFAEKNQHEFSYESHREYKDDRVIIYFSNMPFGNTEFEFNLLPRFSGTFQVPPARVALMYYPEVAAYTQRTQVVIGN